MKNNLILIAMITALSACGGGSGGETPAAASAAQAPSAQAAATVAVGLQKYVGSWTSACINEGAQSAYITVSIKTPTGDTSSGSMIGEGFEYTSCSGRSVTTSVPATFKFVVSAYNGTDTIEVTSLGETTPSTFALSDDGKTLSVNDGEETISFTKQ